VRPTPAKRAGTAKGIDRRFDVALYTVAEAARALDVSPSTLSAWAHGYTRAQVDRRPARGAPVIAALPARDRGGPTIPFVGLAEGMVLAAIRRSGVPLQRIRPALAALASELGIHHALASQRLFTDGAELLYDYAEHHRGPDSSLARDLVVVRSGQRVFSPIVESYLRRITYAPDGYARLIRLPAYERAEVVVDPERSFGQPIFAHGGARVVDVLQRFWAGEDLKTVCDEFGVSTVELEDVLRATSRRAA
jgi:uncharacterized protein (DUF433 family)